MGLRATLNSAFNGSDKLNLRDLAQLAAAITLGLRDVVSTSLSHKNDFCGWAYEMGFLLGVQTDPEVDSLKPVIVAHYGDAHTPMTGSRSRADHRQAVLEYSHFELYNKAILEQSSQGGEVALYPVLNGSRLVIRGVYCEAGARGRAAIGSSLLSQEFHEETIKRHTARGGGGAHIASKFPPEFDDPFSTFGSVQEMALFIANSIGVPLYIAKNVPEKRKRTGLAGIPRVILEKVFSKPQLNLNDNFPFRSRANHRFAAGAFVISYKDRVPYILLGKRSDNSRWTTLGGAADKTDYSFPDTAKREIFEESGGIHNFSTAVFLEAPSHDMIAGHPTYPTQHFRQYFIILPEEMPETSEYKDKEYNAYVWVEMSKLLSFVIDTQTTRYGLNSVAFEGPTTSKDRETYAAHEFLGKESLTAMYFFAPFWTLLKVKDVQTRLEELMARKESTLPKRTQTVTEFA
jgi:8-oxo-dGTP pyrophosphatase MutT (NUDIX family)